MALGLAAALALGLGLWWVGRRQGSGRAWLPLAPAAAAGLAAVMLVPTAHAPAVAHSESALEAHPFSEGRLRALWAADQTGSSSFMVRCDCPCNRRSGRGTG